MLPSTLVCLLAIVSAMTVRAKPRQCLKYFQDIGAVKIDLDKPSTSDEVGRGCEKIGRKLLNYIDELNDEERALCGGQPVPFDKFANADIYQYEDEELWATWALNVTTNTSWIVSEDFLFSCGLCQHGPIKSAYEGPLEYMSECPHFEVSVLSDHSKQSAQITEVAMNALKEVLKRQLHPCVDKVANASSRLDDDERLLITFRMDLPADQLPAKPDTEISVLDESYTMRVEDVSFCPGGDTVDADGAKTSWLTTRIDSLAFNRHAQSDEVTARLCTFNESAYHCEWHPQLIRLIPHWDECDGDDKPYEIEEMFMPLLSEDIRLRHENRLHNFTLEGVDKKAMMEIMRLINQELTVRNAFYDQACRDLAVITSNLTLEDGMRVVSAEDTALIIADLEGNDRYLGFTKESGKIDDVTFNRKVTTKGQAPFAFDIAATIVQKHTRLAFVTRFYHTKTSKSISISYKLFHNSEVTVMFPRKGEVSAWMFTSYGNHHVHITYEDHLPENSRLAYICRAWNNVIGKWIDEGCKVTLTRQDGYSACRCRATYFFMLDGVPTAKYALQLGQQGLNVRVHNNPFTNFLKDKIALMVATAIELLLSLLGLVSIICTAAFFKQWRKNPGNKILLHMVFAITCNLVLGFAVNFVYLSVESIGCLIYGVLRHYSFLAMFLWMLVLSFLQLKRLLTVAGAKATSHLVLKVSAFAWGVPLVPIIILLSISPGYYQGDRFERGYCYPEGLIFHVTVQGPAGIILVVNLGIFVAIVMHIFDCRGENKITRHSKNERAEQLNKLKTSLFMFFLFGFSWIFHILSEERVIDSDFLCEYLFLMTATFHIFVLSLFFVVLQDSTRKDWLTLIYKFFNITPPSKVKPTNKNPPKKNPKAAQRAPKPKKPVV